jgi:hypothetical protein
VSKKLFCCIKKRILARIKIKPFFLICLKRLDRISIKSPLKKLILPILAPIISSVKEKYSSFAKDKLMTGL